MQPRIDPPPEHAWSTMHTCEAVFVTNTKRRTAKRSLQRRLKEFNDGAWMVNPASFECYENIDHNEIELTCCHMPAKILAPENDELRADAPEPDTNLIHFGHEWNPASESPPEDREGPCQCPFFRNDSASKAECSYRPGRLANEWLQWTPLEWPDVDPDNLKELLSPLTYGGRVCAWDMDTVQQLARLKLENPKKYSSSKLKDSHPREWSIVAQIFALEKRMIEPGSLVPFASEVWNHLVPVAAYGSRKMVSIDNDDKANNVAYFGYTVPKMHPEEWQKIHVFWCVCGYRITNIGICLKCKAAIIMAADAITIQTMETEAEYDIALRWDHYGPMKLTRKTRIAVADVPAPSCEPVNDIEDLVWKVLTIQKLKRQEKS